MTTANERAPALLQAEILAEARREAEALIERARAEATSLRAAHQAADAAAHNQRLTTARAEAERRTELLLATVPLEVARHRAEQIEAALHSIRDEARAHLAARDTFDYGVALATLTAAALAEMAGDHFVLKLSPADATDFGDSLLANLPPRVGRPHLQLTLAPEASLDDGGVMVQDATGRQICNNRFTARLERLWPELRRQLAAQLGWSLAPASPGEPA